MAHFTISAALPYLEPLLWLAALAVYLRLKDRLPGVGILLAFRAFGALSLLGLHHATAVFVHADERLLKVASFYTYWFCYFAGFVALLYSLRGIYRFAISRLPNFATLGNICFRWAVLNAVLLGLAAFIPLFAWSGPGGHLLFALDQVGRCLSVLELSLLIFLVIALRAIGFQFHSKVFGLCIGFGAMAIADLMTFSLLFATSRTWPILISEIVTAVMLVAWTVYFLFPDAAPALVTTHIATSASRWNELAVALGENEQKAAEKQPGFLQDVESVVERVLAKNSL
jgi:hypothetical protein